MKTAAVALAAGAVAAFVVTVIPMPLWYLPLAHELAAGAKPHGLVIDYYGRVVAVVVALGAGAAAGHALRAKVSARLAMLCLTWAGFALVMSMALALFHVWGRPLHPLSLPAVPHDAP